MMADLMELWLDKARKDFERVDEDISDVCQSPIEKLMAMGFLCCGMDWITQIDGRRHIAVGGEGLLSAQVRIGKYRADFVFETPPPNYVARVVVECDGHDFHEKTKQQAARDKKRDRELTAAGYTVIHFTGSEIFKDPVSCAREAIDAAWTRSHELLKAAQR